MKRRYFILLAILGSVLILLDMREMHIGDVTKETNSKIPASKTTVKTQAPDEIVDIKKASNLTKQVERYTALIERIGPVLAQEELSRSGLPFDGQSHLLNHTVGDWLYEKHGAAGLVYCRDYFLSSCYHGFVLHAVADEGINELIEVMDHCNKKGVHIAVQCAHAIGHGLLAWVGYANLTQALTRCDQMKTKIADFPLYNCHDGVFMENIWAVHEGAPSKDQWISDSDPVYPCSDRRIAYRYLKACWSNQPMRLYQLFGGNLTQVAGYCLGVRDRDHQVTCFDGLARQIHPLTKGSVDKTFELCTLMPEQWVDPCLISIARAAFSVGDESIPFEICGRINQISRSECYEKLIDIIRAYTSDDRPKRTSLCQKIPRSFASRCLEN